MGKNENEIGDVSGGTYNSLRPEFTFEKYNIGVNDIINDANILTKHTHEDIGNKSLLKLKTASEWIELAKSQPIPKKLFGVLWFEGEVAILFADTNLGKSILAVQIADSISRGEEIRGFPLEALPQLVIYCDFELMAKQFEARYSANFDNHFQISDNFLRIEINPDSEIPDNLSFDEYLNQCLEACIQKTGAKVLIVDNITYLKGETEKARDAAPLMKELKELKNKYGLSILVLAHTPKRDLSKPISRNDLSGSKMLMNFCDSSFAIGESSIDKSVRYIKQIKSRYTEIDYDSENVAIFQIDKPFNFLRFELMNFGKEWEHLKQHSEKDMECMNDKVMELKKRGRSLREIGSELHISHMKVSRIINNCNTL